MVNLAGICDNISILNPFSYGGDLKKPIQVSLRTIAKRWEHQLLEFTRLDDTIVLVPKQIVSIAILDKNAYPKSR